LEGPAALASAEVKSGAIRATYPRPNHPNEAKSNIKRSAPRGGVDYHSLRGAGGLILARASIQPFSRNKTDADRRALDAQIQGAKDSVLILMSQPGSSGTLKSIRNLVKTKPTR
jgi:hypothetical protein